ncbi:hypothetical protein GCM10020367_60320 [Streptomyces sannanensis]|uniref:Uncharacterized protein n=1 Tax=Streptomyces sannanensis TaxID=285536 RepID=A0ABP6SLI9_9ACTN
MVVLDPRQVPHQPGDGVGPGIEPGIEILRREPLDRSVHRLLDPPESVRKHFCCLHTASERGALRQSRADTPSSCPCPGADALSGSAPSEVVASTAEKAATQAQGAGWTR